MTAAGFDHIRNVVSALGLEFTAVSNTLRSANSTAGGDVSLKILEGIQDECAVAMAHGYAKIAGRPMAILLDGPLALKQASMAIYNAHTDCVPVFVIGQTSRAGARPFSNPLRKFFKWTVGNLMDAPQSWISFGDAAAQACRIAMTPPMGPVLIDVTTDLGDSALEGGGTRRGAPAISPPVADPTALRAAVALLIGAQHPLIIAERAARTSEGMRRVVELAELLGSPVISSERMNIPGQHPLAGMDRDAYRPDVVLALEVSDVDRLARRARADGASFIHLSSAKLRGERDSGTPYTGDIDLDFCADAEASLPGLIEECRRRMTRDFASAAELRARQIGDLHANARKSHLRQAAARWDQTPVSPPRLCGELWPLIEHEDWSLVSWQGFLSHWPARLWNFDAHYRYIGGSGAGGLGYGPAAAAGAALANQRHARLSINIQTDGDLMYTPGILSTVVRHRIPLLTVMHNNRVYHAEAGVWRAQAIHSHRNPDQVHIGTALNDPPIDFARMARSVGMYAEGPIADPRELRSALLRGIEKAKGGEPALIDVLTQPR